MAEGASSLLGGLNPLGYLASGVQAGMGIFQLLTAKKRPQLQMPSSVLENKSIAQNAYAEGMPTSAYDNQFSNIARNQAASLYTAGRTRNSSAALAGITEASNNAYGDLNAKDALMRVQNRDKLMQVNNQIASYDWAMQQDKISQAVQQKAAGWQNLWGGASGAANMALFDKKTPNTTPNNSYNQMYSPFYSNQIR